MKTRLVLCFLSLSGCVQSTGGSLVSFHAQAAGDPAVVTGQALTFETPAGYQVTLTRAEVHVGAVYLNQENPQSYTLEESCVQEGIYSGEVRGGVTVDALSPTPVGFPVEGNGTDALTRAAELWLTGGDVFADSDPTVLLAVEGTARRGLDSWPFSGAVTIGQNRVIPPRNPALPGSNPLCRQRIVGPIPFEATLTAGSTLSLFIDPRAFFTSVDFAGLTESGTTPGTYVFVDDGDSAAQPDKALFNALKSAVGPWRLQLQ